MGSEKPGDRLTDEELDKKNQEIKERLKKIMSENPDILMIAVTDKDAGLAMQGREDWCMPCFAKYVIFTAMNHYTMHNIAAHAEDLKRDVAEEAFERIGAYDEDGNTRTN